jgi:hypothetical protein
MMMNTQNMEPESIEAVYTHSPYSFHGPEYHTRIVHRCDSPSSNLNRSRLTLDQSNTPDNAESFSSCDVSYEDLASLYRSSSSSSAHSTPRHDSFKRKDDSLPAALLHRRLEVIAKRYNADEDNHSEPRSRASSQIGTPQSLSFIFDSVSEEATENEGSTVTPSMSGEFSNALSLSDMLAPIQSAKAIVSRKGGCQKSMMKSKMCKHWLETQDCPYGARCAYAHGSNELRRKMMF